MFELSENKKKIVAHNGHLLVHGGPGCGKTTVSIIKAEALVSGPLRPTQKVLFLSFARATVARVIEALAEHSASKPEARRRVDVDTYHAFFWRLLQSHGYLLGLPRRLSILAPPAQAVALSSIRHEFGPTKKLNEVDKKKKLARETEELHRLAIQEGKVCFDLFADFAAQLLDGSTKICQLVSSAYPVIILDEFQDTSAEQWRVVQCLGKNSTLIALADPEQRIYDFIGADVKRLDHFRERFKPLEIDLSGENHRSGGTDIATFGNDLLKGKFRKSYVGMSLFLFPPNQNQAIAALKGQTLQARKRLLELGNKHWSLAVLVPTKRMMRQVSDAFRIAQPSMPAINHRAAIDMEGAILAAEVIAFFMQPRAPTGDFEAFVELVCNFYCGKGGDDPSATDINQSVAVRKAFEKSLALRDRGKAIPANSIMVPMIAGYERARSLTITGNPDDNWTAVRKVMMECGCKRLADVVEESRNVRFLDRGTQLREALALDWRNNGSYLNALDIVRQAFIREHFAVSGKPEAGVVVMNMHKAKGKQFDEVIIFEGWPIRDKRDKNKIASNPDRIVRGNSDQCDLTHARYTFRVSVTRAKMRTTILTPKGNPCILLKSGNN